jgi:hypothetical protein
MGGRQFWSFGVASIMTPLFLLTLFLSGIAAMDIRNDEYG